MDKKVYSLTISLLGILILLILSIVLPPESLSIGTLNSGMCNKIIKIQGKTTFIKDYNKFLIIRIKDDSGEIDVFLEKNKFEKIAVQKDDSLEVIGKLTEYKNKLQIKAQKIFFR